VVSTSAGQSEAVRRVTEQMGRVRDGVEQIRRASAAQEAQHQGAREASQAVAGVAGDVRVATEAQALGTARIGESIETVRATVQHINRALEEQLSGIREARGFLESTQGHTTATQESARRIDEAMRGLHAQAERLRASVERFRV
jgi:methyl-accepting chemotaxis protein